MFVDQIREMQGLKDIYLPVTLKCAQESVLMAFIAYSVLTDRHDIAIGHV